MSLSKVNQDDSKKIMSKFSFLLNSKKNNPKDLGTKKHKITSGEITKTNNNISNVSTNINDMLLIQKKYKLNNNTLPKPKFQLAYWKPFIKYRLSNLNNQSCSMCGNSLLDRCVICYNEIDKKISSSDSSELNKRVYSNNNINDISDIGYQKCEIKTSGCKVSFHLHCLNKILEVNNKCPSCHKNCFVSS